MTQSIHSAFDSVLSRLGVLREQIFPKTIELSGFQCLILKRSQCKKQVPAELSVKDAEGSDLCQPACLPPASRKRQKAPTGPGSFVSWALATVAWGGGG